MKQKNQKKTIKCDYYKIKEIKDSSSILNILRECDKSDIYKTFNRIMSDYENGIEEVELILVSDVQPIIMQQLSLFASYFSIDLLLIKQTNALKTIFDENVRVIGVKRGTKTFEKINEVLKNLEMTEKDIYDEKF
ncbi:hypothetical protein NBO_54g0007 [Nosema bombycis CQ1]|uniref:Uncharacterized protein n=1 Tax=Nosema bombycis (strain CQ1 / CVCC 102059) TaxID=578461 RepID=R0KSX2_NOSB1|nr:hypothetical protein NBO_54g0007 [Nosema bombycis CQ1]|eukprot:EOB13861.1 hypothetical protein NBO_54g0007 [Nosema bombycis CQ1]